uniref:Arf-GAP with coiled-coil, ANK repeat and PH domain-containing protein 2 n=1 Tax=Dracunculus medinensis TaxID=318479 RepID=A0A0N4ULP1_DRAME
LKMNVHFQRDLEKLEERISIKNTRHHQLRNELFDLKDQLEANGEFLRSHSASNEILLTSLFVLLIIKNLGRRLSNRHESQKSMRLSISQLGVIGSGSNIAMSSCGGNDNEGFCDFRGGSMVGKSIEWPHSGYLYKKSNKKIHKQWQKRRCRIQDGHFLLSHSDESLPPAKLNLLVSDCKPSADDAKAFDLYCRDRTYHLQADTEAEAKKWMVALRQEISRLKTKMLTDDSIEDIERITATGTDCLERKLCVKAVRNLSGNKECADCSSSEDVQWLSNTGALVCIACSGVHRELGVHISRIQSLDLDVISPTEFLIPLSSGNSLINRIYEWNEHLCLLNKPVPGCTRFDRQKFIQMKYRNRCFIQRIESANALFAEAARHLDFEKAYRALLSPEITSLPFLAHEAFHEMIRQGSSLALPIAQLVVQFRFLFHIFFFFFESNLLNFIKYGILFIFVIDFLTK